MASELGSMVVTEQIDAMRALGVDPMRKLVTPRLFACITMLFLSHHPRRRIRHHGRRLRHRRHEPPERHPVFSMAWEHLRYPTSSRAWSSRSSPGSSSPRSAASTACAPPAAPRAWADRQSMLWSSPPSSSSSPTSCSPRCYSPCSRRSNDLSRKPRTRPLTRHKHSVPVLFAFFAKWAGNHSPNCLSRNRFLPCF